MNRTGADVLVVDDEQAIADLVEVYLKTRYLPCINSITVRTPSGAWNRNRFTFDF